MKPYIPPVRPLGYTRDKAGRVLSYRDTDGTGYDIIRDKAGYLLSYRDTDGTGYDIIRDKAGYLLSLRHTDGTGYSYTRDKAGRELSYRHTDGAGYDYTYDKAGRIMSFRRTDGTGYDVIAYDNDYDLYRNLDGTYTAGCSKNLTLAQALAHWGAPRTDDRALLFTLALGLEPQ
jgi:YD repeat-containing protein